MLNKQRKSHRYLQRKIRTESSFYHSWFWLITFRHFLKFKCSKQLHKRYLKKETNKKKKKKNKKQKQTTTTKKKKQHPPHQKKKKQTKKKKKKKKQKKKKKTKKTLRSHTACSLVHNTDISLLTPQASCLTIRYLINQLKCFNN